MKVKYLNLHCEELYASNAYINNDIYNNASIYVNISEYNNNEIKLISFGKEYKQKVNKKDELKLSKLIETLRFDYNSISI